MTEQTIFYIVMDLTNPEAEPFAVLRVDTQKRAGNGCEAVVQSLHWDRDDAVLRASQMQMVEGAAVN